MKPLHLVLAFAAVTCAQKPLKHKKAYLAHSPGGPAGLPVEAAPAYHGSGGHGGQSSVSNHGFGGGHGQQGSNSFSGIGKGGSKPVYPLLLSDTRTLNPDGTINFDYKADNGLHQGETVDSDGTRRGFYSYPGADGKLITVKYTAGKNGFVAEGPHLPKQPQAAAHNAKQQDDIYSSNKGSHFGGGGQYSQSSPLGGHGGAYRPGGHSAALSGHGGQANHYSHSSGLGGGNSNAFANFPDFSSQFPSAGSGGHGEHGGSYSSGGAGRYQGSGAGAALSGVGGGNHHSGHQGGSSSFSTLHGLGSTGNSGGANANFADIGSSFGGFSGPTFTANNPYQPTLASANPSNPVNAGFDLGNGGHFSINFTPGATQEYNTNEFQGDFGSGAAHGGHQQQGASYAGASGHGAGAQGRY